MLIDHMQQNVPNNIYDIIDVYYPLHVRALNLEYGTREQMTLIGKSHMIHHIHRNPKPQDAFYTGFIDAIIQLILPLYLVLIAVSPSRYSAILFGCIYSWWLLFIHSDPQKEYPLLDYLHLVTPRMHHQHHQMPSTNFSNIFYLLGAEEPPAALQPLQR